MQREGYEWQTRTRREAAEWKEVITGKISGSYNANEQHLFNHEGKQWVMKKN